MINADDLWNRIKQHIKPEWKSAFFATVIAGFLMHLYPMTHHFLTYDSLWNQFSNQDMIASGRQFLMYACGISSFFDLPWVNGVLSIFYLGITAIVITEAFELKDRFFAALGGILLVSFPAIVSTFCYAYTIDGYMLALLCSALAYLVTRKYKWGFIPGIILVGFSLGVYQAYYSFTILLCILGLLKDVLTKEKTKELLGKIPAYLGMGIGGYAFYVITLKIMLALKDAEISGYQGTDKILAFSVADIPRGLFAALKSFGSFALRSNVLTANPFMTVAFVLLILAAVGIYLSLFIRRKCYRSFLKIAMVLALCICIPFGTTMVLILSPDAFFHLLMRYPWVLFFIFVPVLCQEFFREFDGKRIAVVTAVTVSIATGIMIFSFAVNGNIAYFNLNERYEKSYAYCIRLADRLEETEGYETGDKVAVIGGFPKAEYYPSTDITAEVLEGYFGAGGDLVVNSTDKYAAFFERFLNVTITQATYEEEAAMIENAEFLEMECFPKEGCIKEIDGIYVIKING